MGFQLPKGECRCHAPSMNGFPQVYGGIACSEFRPSQEAIDARSAKRRNAAGRPVGLFIVRYNNLEGRHVLDGVTRGAHTSRLTVHQDIQVVGNTHEKHFNVKEYAHV